MDKKVLLKNLFIEGLERCSPHQAIQQYLQRNGHEIKIKDRYYSVDDYPVYLFAVGKAAVPMHESASQILKNNVAKSLVITPDGREVKKCTADEVLVGSHPTPDAHSLTAGERTISFMEALAERAIIINLISGGTSSLLSMPAAGISITALAKTFELLNNSGATIHQINTVRKHCSQVKGGQLLRHISSGVKVIDLAISDVPDDDLSIIGSGPTIPDRSTFEDAHQVLKMFDLWDTIPESVRSHIQKGIHKKTPETVKPNEEVISYHYSKVISSASKLANNVAELAREQNFSVSIAKEPFNEDVQIVATDIARTALSQDGKNDDGKPHLLIFWGESTVKVTGNGKGGRNQELALHVALKIAGHPNITLLSAGTDGIDGPTDAAGAVVDGTTIKKAKNRNIDPQTYLESNDSYHFHQQIGTLFKTGPTGNNLMDLVLILIV